MEFNSEFARRVLLQILGRGYGVRSTYTRYNEGDRRCCTGVLSPPHVTSPCIDILSRPLAYTLLIFYSLHLSLLLLRVRMSHRDTIVDQRT